jgi:hypothetical protein
MALGGSRIRGNRLRSRGLYKRFVQHITEGAAPWRLCGSQAADRS